LFRSKRWKQRVKAPGISGWYSYFVTFKFPDGTEKEFNVQNADIYESLEKGDVGIISFKQVGDGTGFMGKRFINFEKDN
jgi:hypothetical protein